MSWGHIEVNVDKWSKMTPTTVPRAIEQVLQIEIMVI